MKTWEIVVDVHVRKTLCFSGPDSEAEARMIIAAYARPGSLPIATLQKFGPDMRPVEELIGAAEVVSVKEVRQAADLIDALERMREAVADVLDYRGGADCACRDEHVLDRLRGATQESETPAGGRAVR